MSVHNIKVDYLNGCATDGHLFVDDVVGVCITYFFFDSME